MTDLLEIKRFSLFKLAKITGYNYETLRTWVGQGWLLPASKLAKQNKYTLHGLKIAEELSLGRRKNMPIPTSPSMEKRIKYVFGDD